MLTGDLVLFRAEVRANFTDVCYRVKKMEVVEKRIGSNSAFYSTLCIVCKSSDELKRCSRCKMISYCCPNHQKKHWTKHKQFCNAVYKATMLGGLTLPGQDRLVNRDGYYPQTVWTDQITAWMSVIEISMRRQLDADERSMLMFPKSCRVCRDMDHKNLSTCSLCKSVSYCSQEHCNKDLPRHSKDCPHLVFSFQTANFLIQTKDLGNQPHPELYFPLRSTYCHLPMDIHSYITPSYVKCTSTKDKILRSIAYGGHSNPLTLLYALEKINFPIDRKSLVVHIVGADLEESIRFPCWEDVLHWLPDLKELKLILVGPNATTFYETRYAPLCDDCTERNKSLHATVHTELYHDYFQSDSFIKPDIVAAYNCGFHEFEGASNDTWSASLPLLASSWLIFTSFNAQDAERDLRCMQNASKKFKVVLEIHENPFRRTNPWREFECDTVFFQNYYLTVLKKE